LVDKKRKLWSMDSVVY